MQIGATGRFATLFLAGVLGACQGSSPAPTTAVTTPAAPPIGPDEARSPASRIDWAGAGDCLDQLTLLDAAAMDGRLEEAHAPPFAVALVTPSTSLEWVSAAPVPVVADLPLESYEDQGTAAAAAPCLLLVEQPGDVRAAHRVVNFQTVAAQYQSGVRSERNPDYDAAQARLREAERGTKDAGSGILRVGDPMLDLVGLLVGGVIATFGQIGSDDDLDDALAALKETPRSRDRPIYRAYEFERSIVRAGKEATIRVALRDLRRGRVWRTEIRQREMRQFSVLEGLDPRDRDYEQHRAGALSWQEFEHWQQQPPQLPMSALVAALVARGGATPGALPGGSAVAAADPATLRPVRFGAAEPRSPAVLPPLAALAPAQGPESDPAPEGQVPVVSDAPASVELDAPRRIGAGADRTVFTAALDPRAASLVRLEAGGRRGNGLYVKPRLVVTTSDLVGAASVIDVTTSTGEAVLGLVVHADPARGLALVHVPRAGSPAPLLDGPVLGPGQSVDVLELVGAGQARLTRATLQPPSALSERSAGAAVLRLGPASTDAATSTGAPVFVEDRALGLLAAPADGPERTVVSMEALDQLLESGTLAALP